MSRYFLLGDNREREVARTLYNNIDADIERELLSEEEKLVIQEASPGSLFLLLVAKSKLSYRAILYACAVPFVEGRKALIGRVNAGTELAELEVRAKEQDIRLKQANSVLDLAKKIDTIKDPDTRKLIRERFLADMTNLVSPKPTLPVKFTLENDPIIDTTAAADVSEATPSPRR